MEERFLERFVVGVALAIGMVERFDDMCELLGDRAERGILTGALKDLLETFLVVTGW